MKKILLIEDTPDLLENITDVLRMEEFEVVSARDGIEALEKLSTYMPDLIITDLLMPRMDGFTFIQNIKKNKALKAIPVLVFSAKATAENEAEGLKLGAVQYLKKPCPTEFFIEIIHNLIIKN